jgi:hypothetical protein
MSVDYGLRLPGYPEANRNFAMSHHLGVRGVDGWHCYCRELGKQPRLAVDNGLRVTTTGTSGLICSMAPKRASRLQQTPCPE